MPFRPVRLPICVAVSALGACATQAIAQTERDPAAVLPAVEVSAEVEATSTVDARTLARYQATDLEDVFASQPEVGVGGGHGIAQKVYVRGIEDTLVNVSVDGAALVGQVFHHTGRIGIEPELLKRVEVDAGTGDATTGPGALGGAIRFVTKDPDDLLRPGERAGGQLKAGYFSNGEGYKLTGSAFGRVSDSWSTLFMVSRQDRNDYEDGNGSRVGATGARDGIGFAKLVGELTPHQTLRVSVERRDEKGDRSQRPQWIPSDWNQAYPLEATQDSWTLNHHWQSPDASWLNLETIFYGSSNALKQNITDRWGIWHGRSQTRGARLANTSEVGGASVTYGIDERRDRVTAGPDGDRSAERERGRAGGVFAQARIPLGDDWMLGAGGRFDRYRLVDAAGQRFNERGFSPNLELRYQLSPMLALRVAHARALRGPQIRDAFKLDVASNAPDLKAERARSSEIGFEYLVGHWTFDGKLYHTRIADAIADPLGRPVRFENVGDLRSRGALLQAAYRVGALSAAVGLHHNDARLNGKRLNVYEHNGLGNSIGDTLSMQLDYQLTPELEVGWQGRFVKGLGNIETSVGTVRKPGYGVHDVHASWQTRGDALSVTLTVRNLFDKHYLDHASNESFEHIAGYEGVVGSPEPGREIRIGLAWRF
ncbi:MAG: TonB-dependent receptor domain-containing protein [Rhodocyclaceae bacterium]